MALPYLPVDKIVTNFERLERDAATDALQDLVSYIRATWIDSRTWPPRDWCVYRVTIRTNNDLEGWHHGLNRRAGGKTHLPLYLLILHLEQEAKLVSTQIRLVQEGKLERIQRKKYREVNQRLFQEWDSYEAGDKSSKKLLKCIARIYGPRTE